MKSFINIFVLFLGFLSCKENKNPEKQLQHSFKEHKEIPNNFKGKLFAVGPDIYEDKVVLECDCCSSDVYFIDGKRFVEIAYCLEGDTYLSGTYKINETGLELIFDKKSLLLENTWSKEIDSTSTEPEFVYMESSNEVNRKVIWKKEYRYSYFETSEGEFSEPSNSDKKDFLKAVTEDKKIKLFLNL